MKIIKRELLDKVLPWLDERKIILIKGARQVGKTTLLYYLKDILEEQNKRVIYFSIDQEITNPIFKEPKLLINYLKNEYNIHNRSSYLILDEVQYIKSTGFFLKVLFDITKSYLNIIVSGSSTLRLSEDKEFLTGRKIEFLLTPFSFLEHLRAKSSFKYNLLWKVTDRFKILSDFYKTYKEDLEQHFVDYINWGGYPEVVLHSQSEKRMLILKEIINTYIRKDVIDFLRIENVSGFNNLISILCSQIGNLVNKNELSNTLNLHSNTLNKYLDILEGTFIFSFLSPFYTNIRKELSKMQKVYLNNIGLLKQFTGIEYDRYLLINGKSIENFVYNNLRSTFDKGNIFFYRTISKSEIDFIVKSKDELIPVEVKFRQKPKVPISIKRFKDKYNNVKKTVVVTKNILREEKQVYFFPVILLPFIKFEI